MPIVFSRRFVGNVLPSDSFIAIDDFNSTEELKEHLERLQNDDEEYLKWGSFWLLSTQTNTLDTSLGLNGRKIAKWETKESANYAPIFMLVKKFSSEYVVSKNIPYCACNIAISDDPPFSSFFSPSGFISWWEHVYCSLNMGELSRNLPSSEGRKYNHHFNFYNLDCSITDHSSLSLLSSWSKLWTGRETFWLIKPFIHFLFNVDIFAPLNSDFKEGTRF